MSNCNVTTSSEMPGPPYNPMEQYSDLVRKILSYGEEREDRTGVGTLSLCAPAPIKFDLSKSFPIVGQKKTNYRAAFVEMLWFLRGGSNVKELHAEGVHIWDEWADERGELGPVYGSQWRSWGADSRLNSIHVDQIQLLVEQLKENPQSRRHLVTAWNVADLDKMALPPCHFAFQVYITNDNRLNLQLMLRSSDVFLGLPFNIAQYGLLACLLARECRYKRGELTVIFTGDAHIYKNHIQQATELIQRRVPAMPELFIETWKPMLELSADDIIVAGYEHMGFLKGDVAV